MALVLCIAVGVGLAALIGTIRTIRAWSLKLIIFISTTISLSLTVAMQLSPASEITGMAWDSGAVTTGCVTVPLVLAMGLGIGSKTGAIDGFGVLALASIGPIITVLTVGLIVRKKPKTDEDEIITATETV